MGDEEREALIERIEVLETKVGFQDRTIDALNEVVTSQHDRLDALEARVAKLREMAESMVQGEVESGEEPPPPHY